MYRDDAPCKVLLREPEPSKISWMVLWDKRIDYGEISSVVVVRYRESKFVEEVDIAAQGYQSTSIQARVLECLGR